MRILARSVQSDNGFSLIEVMVAIFVGIIALTMAISVLFTTNSSGIRIMSKQEVSSNTRLAMTRILKDVGSAQSLLRCTIWKSSELQIEYETYIRRIENGGDDPSTPIVESGIPTFSGSSADCLEYYETGHVLLRVLPNSLCWFKDLSPGTDDVIDYSKPFETACLFRGGAGRDANYDSMGDDVGFSGAGVLPMPCSPEPTAANDQDILYYIECTYNDQNMHYFVPNETVYGTWSVKDSSFRQVLELGEINDQSTHNRKNVFSFVDVSGSTPDFVSGFAGANTGDILYVNVNMEVLYFTGTKNSDGTKEQRAYHYTQTILLQGAKTYNDEGAYSDKFTG